MANKTPLIGLAKPELSEYASVGMLNGNTDKIDAALGQRSRVPNLVINGNFMPGYIVNQRGESSYTGAKYGVDMWKGQTDLTTISVSADGLSVFHGGTSGWAMAVQKFPSHIYDAYYNSTLTIAACLSDGTVAAKSGIPSDGSFEAHLSSTVRAQLYVSDANGYIAVRLTNGSAGSTATFRWVAVYPGAFTANTLPDYQPKSYVETLKECLRYVKAITSDYIFGRCTSTTAYLDVPTDVPMAAKPTITVDTPGAVRANGLTVDVTALAVSGIRAWSIPLTATYASTSNISNHAGSLNNAKFVLSCEPT